MRNPFIRARNFGKEPIRVGGGGNIGPGASFNHGEVGHWLGGAGIPPFDPRFSFLPGGQVGHWFGAPDSPEGAIMGRFFQDAAGTIPALLPGDPIGLMSRSAGNFNFSQTGGQYKPLLGRRPRNGRRNMLTHSEDFFQSAWQKQNSVAVGPRRVLDNTASSSHLLRRVFGGLAAGDYTLSFEIRAISPVLAITLLASYSSGSGSWHLNLVTGTLVQGTTVIPTTCTVEAAPDGYWRVKFTISAAEPLSYWDMRMATSWPFSSGSGQTYTGDGTGGLELRNIQFEVGGVATAYQRTGTDLDVTENGQKDLWYMLSDGVDDFLAAASQDWNSAEMTIVIPFERETDTVTGRLIHSRNGGDGSLLIEAPGVIGNANYGYIRAEARGTAGTQVGVGTSKPNYAGKVPLLLSVRMSIPQSYHEMRINGVLENHSNGTLGSGLLSSGTPRLFRNDSGSMPFSGRVYDVYVINRYLPDSELKQIESWMANEYNFPLAA